MLELLPTARDLRQLNDYVKELTKRGMTHGIYIDALIKEAWANTYDVPRCERLECAKATAFMYCDDRSLCPKHMIMDA